MKKIIALVLALILALSFAACSSNEPAEEVNSGNESSENSEANEESVAEPVTITVGASPAPHAEILEAAKEVLAEEGYELVIVEFTDYVLPNEALTSGDIDANYFQHQPYLDNYNANNGTDIVSAGSIHYEPLGVYPGKTASIEELADGAQIAIPNDGSNEARALYLLQDLGLITVDDSKGYDITVIDVVDNPKNLELIETAAEQLPNVLPDVDLAVINGNYAIGAGIDGSVLTTEDKDSAAAQTYANIVAVNAGHENDEKIVALVNALQSEEVRAFIEETYGVSVVPIF